MSADICEEEETEDLQGEVPPITPLIIAPP